MATILKTIFMISALMGSCKSLAKDTASTNKELDHTPRHTHYVCEINRQTNSASVNVKIDSESLLMEVQLDEGTTIKGYAVMTLDARKETSAYHLQGSLSPQTQQLNLVINASANTAHFTRAYGGAIFVCRET